MSSPNLSNAVKLNDTDIVKQAQNGNRQAFSELVQRHQASVYRSCYRILGHDEDAKDASQETFLRAYRKLDTFQGRSTFKTWLLRVAMNVSLNEHTSRSRRRKASYTNTDLLAQSIPSPEAPEDELIRSEAAVRMHDALELVRPEQRAAIVLRDVDGLAYQEIAKTLEIAEGTAKSWVHRGRKRLKGILIAA